MRVFKCTYNSKLHNYYVVYRGQDSITKFLKEIQKIAQIIHKEFQTNFKIDMTEADKKHFLEATSCHICGESFETGGGGGESFETDYRERCEVCAKEGRVCWPCSITYRKVKDHFHFQEKNNYRGAAHSKCNTLYRTKQFIPVIFHNLSGYDTHLFVKKLAREFNNTLNTIPKFDENYISYSIRPVVDEKIVETGGKYCSNCVKQTKIARDIT